MKTIITPKEASGILEKSIRKNRHISTSNLKYLVDEIKSGKFEYNGESVIIDEDGNLLDGHHRLKACIEADLPITVELVIGVPRSVMTTIDTGKMRSGGDILEMKGIKSSKNAATIVREIISKMGLRTRNDGAVLFNKAPNREILDFYNAHNLEINAVNDLSRHLYSSGIGSIIPQGAIGGFLYLMSYIDSNKSIDFMREVMLGITINQNSNVAIVLRNKLLKAKLSNTIEISRMAVRQLVLKAFYVYCKNEDRRNLYLLQNEVVVYPSIDLSTKAPINISKIESLIR